MLQVQLDQSNARLEEVAEQYAAKVKALEARSARAENEVKRLQSHLPPEVTMLGTAMQGEDSEQHLYHTHDTTTGIPEPIEVSVRVRPALPSDSLGAGSVKCCVYMAGRTTMIRPQQGDARSFTFDHSYWSYDNSTANFASQTTVFADCERTVVPTLWKGINTAVICYGASGAGKTYTMLGPEDQSQQGVAQMLISSIFSILNGDAPAHTECTLSMSVVEVFHDRCRDLLSSDPASAAPSLLLKENRAQGAFFSNAIALSIRTEEEALSLLSLAHLARTARTSGPAVTHFGHFVACLTLDQKTVVPASSADGRPSVVCRRSRLTLVEMEAWDLPTISSCHVSPVLSVLAEHTAGTAVPFRATYMTRYLKSILVGNAKTLFLASISPCDAHFEDSANTLLLASNMKRVRTRPAVVLNAIASMKETLAADVSALTSELAALSDGRGISSTLVVSEFEAHKTQFLHKISTLRASQGRITPVDLLDVLESLEDDAATTQESPSKHSRSLRHVMRVLSMDPTFWEAVEVDCEGGVLLPSFEQWVLAHSHNVVDVQLEMSTLEEILKERKETVETLSAHSLDLYTTSSKLHLALQQSIIHRFASRPKCDSPTTVCYTDSLDSHEPMLRRIFNTMSGSDDQTSLVSFLVVLMNSEQLLPLALCRLLQSIPLPQIDQCVSFPEALQWLLDHPPVVERAIVERVSELENELNKSRQELATERAKGDLSSVQDDFEALEGLSAQVSATEADLQATLALLRAEEEKTRELKCLCEELEHKLALIDQTKDSSNVSELPLADLQAQVDSYTTLLAEKDKELAAHVSEISSLRCSLAEIERSNATLRASLEEIEHSNVTLRASLKESEEANVSLRASLEESEKARASAQADLVAATAKSKAIVEQENTPIGVAVDVEDEDSELVATKRDLEQATSDLQGSKLHLSNAEAQLFETKEALTSVEAQLELVKDQMVAERTAHEEVVRGLRVQIQALQAQPGTTPKPLSGSASPTVRPTGVISPRDDVLRTDAWLIDTPNRRPPSVTSFFNMSVDSEEDLVAVDEDELLNASETISSLKQELRSAKARLEDFERSLQEHKVNDEVVEQPARDDRHDLKALVDNLTEERSRLIREKETLEATNTNLRSELDTTSTQLTLASLNAASSTQEMAQSSSQKQGCKCCIQ